MSMFADIALEAVANDIQKEIDNCDTDDHIYIVGLKRAKEIVVQNMY